jgi:ABA4-like protein
MYPRLFDLTGGALLGWALLIVLPTWRVTRWVAASALFPVYLCLLYAVGAIGLLIDSGPGIMRDFGSAGGVIGLLRQPDIALVAWIHILALDQFAGLYVYRDNMRQRYVPLPVQSMVLALTLMLGPLGLLTYLVLRAVRRARSSGPGLRTAVDPFPDGVPEPPVRAQRPPSPGTPS